MEKAIHRYRQGSKIGTLSTKKRPSTGIGWIIIPSDIDREEYIRRVYSTGYCMIISDFNDPIRDVAVPEHLIRNIKFPVLAEERGSLVSWMSIAKSDQVILMGILQAPAGSSPYKEGTTIDEVDSADTRISKVLSIKDKSYTISIISDESGEGGFEVKAQGGDKTTSMAFNIDGTASIKSDDKLTIFAENEITVKMASKEDEISTLSMTKEGVLAYLDRYGNSLQIGENGWTYEDEFGNRQTIGEGSFQMTDDFGNDFDMNAGGFHLENEMENFITLMNDTLKMYMQTKTIDGKVLDPLSIQTAVDLIRRFNTLFN